MLEVPRLAEGSLRDAECYRCRPADMEALGLPAGLVPDWKERFLRKFAEMLGKYRALRLFMDICVRCGNCADRCHVFLGSGDPRNMPVARQELMRAVYRRYFTAAGRLFGRGRELDEETLKLWYVYFHQCSMCRRCSIFCPFGIDTAEITWAAREIMAEIGLASRYLTEVVHKCYARGNNLGIPPAGWKDSAKFLEEELKEETGRDIRVPVDEPGADVLFITPSADMFGPIHTRAMMGYAKVFWKLGISWTTSTYASEAGNFGSFLRYEDLKKVNRRMTDAIREFRPKRWIIGECGHAWGAAYTYTHTLNGDLRKLGLDPRFPVPQHVCEFTWSYIRDGALRMDRSKNDRIRVTYHDPCNVARRSGVLFEAPRNILRACCNHFVEMPRDTTHESTFCCGGGGGLLTDEMMPARIAGARPRLDAATRTFEKDDRERGRPFEGENWLVTPCAICKSQFEGVIPKMRLPVPIEPGGVHDLVGNALVLDG